MIPKNNQLIEDKDYDADACFDFISSLIIDCFDKLPDPKESNKKTVDNFKKIEAREQFLDSPLVDNWYCVVCKSIILSPISLSKHFKRVFKHKLDI
jgi:hypothetical protein